MDQRADMPWLATKGVEAEKAELGAVAMALD